MSLALRRSLPVLVALTMASAGALADPSPADRAAAESLFRLGRELMEKGNYAEACRKLEESQRLDPAPGALLNLAVCHEKEGKIATAWTEFNQALAFARRDGRADREKIAREKIAAIEKLLPKLQIDVPAAARVPGLQVARNGAPLAEGAWGVSIATDPGQVLVEASAKGYKRWQKTFTVKPGEVTRVDIPPLDPEPVAPPVASVAPPPVASASAPPPPSTSAPPPPPPPPPSWTSRQVAGVVLGGVGVVGLGVGAYFGLHAISKRSDSDAFCPHVDGRDRCDSEGVRLNEQARSSARVANIGVGLGLVAIASGVFLYFAGSSPEPAATGRAPGALRWTMGLNGGSRGAAATLEGTW